MINYSLPNFDGDYLELNILFARLFQENPEWMQPGVCIKSVYGAFPSFDLNGGRVYVGQKTPKKEMEKSFSLLAKCGIYPRITCTNQLVTKQKLSEPYTKQVLETAAKYNGQAIVFLDEIGKSIKEIYGMPIILTTNRHLQTAKEVNAACETYDTVVLNYNNHKNPDLLNELQYPKKIEVMANEYCRTNCVYRKEHSLSESRLQLAKKNFGLNCKYNNKFGMNKANYSVFTPEEIQEYSHKYKVCNFKIVGREAKIYEIFRRIKKYLVLPTYEQNVNSYFKKHFSNPDALII